MFSPLEVWVFVPTRGTSPNEVSMYTGQGPKKVTKIHGNTHRAMLMSDNRRTTTQLKPHTAQMVYSPLEERKRGEKIMKWKKKKNHHLLFYQTDEHRSDTHRMRTPKLGQSRSLVNLPFSHTFKSHSESLSRSTSLWQWWLQSSLSERYASTAHHQFHQPPCNTTAVKLCLPCCLHAVHWAFC